jgi:hypothetical protein
MSRYPVHTIDSAPAQSKPVLEQVKQAFGVIPNIAGAMAGSPVLIGGFFPLFQQVHAGSLTEAQIQTNACEWAVAFHSVLALQQGLSRADVDAIRHGDVPHAADLAALSTLARTLIDKRGRLADADQTRFLDAGFRTEQVLEVIAVVAASTITNYTGSVTQPPLEAAFQEFAWHAVEA